MRKYMVLPSASFILPLGVMSSSVFSIKQHAIHFARMQFVLIHDICMNLVQVVRMYCRFVKLHLHGMSIILGVNDERSVIESK